MKPFLVAGRVWVDLDHVQEIEVLKRLETDRTSAVMRWRCAFRDQPSVLVLPTPEPWHENHETCDAEGAPCAPDRSGYAFVRLSAEALERMRTEHWQPFFDAWSHRDA